MKAILIATLIACTLFSTASCFLLDSLDVGDFIRSSFSPTKPSPPVRHCRWLNWKGTKCVKNPFGTPKYIIYQRRTKIGASNGGRPCVGFSYRMKECLWMVKDRVKRGGPILSTLNRDVLFLLDESESITKEKFPLLKEMVNALLSQLSGDISIGENKTRVAAMTFNSEATIHFGFDYSFIRADLINKINKIPYSYNGGGSCLRKALKKAKDHMFTTTDSGARYGSARTERLIFLLSDGCANCDPGKLVDMKKQFEDEKISFVAFFIGKKDRCVNKIMKDLFTGAKSYEAFRADGWEDFQGMIDYIKRRGPVTEWQYG